MRKHWPGFLSKFSDPEFSSAPESAPFGDHDSVLHLHRGYSAGVPPVLIVCSPLPPHPCPLSAPGSAPSLLLCHQHDLCICGFHDSGWQIRYTERCGVRDEVWCRSLGVPPLPVQDMVGEAVPCFPVSCGHGTRYCCHFPCL